MSSLLALRQARLRLFDDTVVQDTTDSLSSPDPVSTTTNTDVKSDARSESSPTTARESDSVLLNVLAQQATQFPETSTSYMGIPRPIPLRASQVLAYVPPKTLDQDDTAKYIAASLEAPKPVLFGKGGGSKGQQRQRMTAPKRSDDGPALQSPANRASKTKGAGQQKSAARSRRKSSMLTLQDELDVRHLGENADVDEEDDRTKKNRGISAAWLLACEPSKFNSDAELRRRFGAASRRMGRSSNEEHKNEAFSYSSRRDNSRTNMLRRLASLRARSSSGRKSLILAPVQNIDVFVLEQLFDGSKSFTIDPADAFQEWAQSKVDVLMSQRKTQLPVTIPQEELVHLPPPEPNQHGTYFRFSPNFSYAHMQRAYVSAVNTYDPQAIADFVHRYPTHLDGLLQLANILESMGRHGPAHVLVQQVLVICELSLPKLFSLTQGDARLVLYHPEKPDAPFTPNQREENAMSTAMALAFLCALARNAQMLSKKAAPGAALESAKLALSLAPSDPYCMLQLMDYYALRAQQYPFITRFISEYAWPMFGVVGPTLLDALQLQFPSLAKKKTAAAEHVPLASRSLTIDELNRRSEEAKSESKSQGSAGAATGTITHTGYYPAALLPNWCFSAALAQFHLENSITDNNAARLNRDESKLCAISVGLLRAYKPSYIPALARAFSSLASGESPAASKDSAVPIPQNFVLELVQKYDASDLSTVLATHPLDVPVVATALLPPRPQKLADMGTAPDAPLQVSSAQLLQRAIALFPEAIRAIISAIDARKLETKAWREILEVLEHPWNSLGSSNIKRFYAENQWIERLVHVYAARTASMWRSDAALEFLQEQAQHVVTKLKEGAWQPQAIERVRQTLFTKLPLAVRQLQRSDYTDEVASLPEELNRPQRLERQRQELGGQAIFVEANAMGQRQRPRQRQPEDDLPQEIFYEDEDYDEDDEDEDDDFGTEINRDAGLFRAFVESLLPWRTAPSSGSGGSQPRVDQNAQGTAEVEDSSDDEQQDEQQ